MGTRTWLLVVTIGLAAFHPACSSGDASVDATGSTEAETTTSAAGAKQEAIEVIVLRDDGAILPDTEIGCGSGTSPAFPSSALDEVPTIEESGIPGLEAGLAPFLTGEEGQFWPQDGWRVLYATDSRVQVVNLASPEAGDGPSFMTLEGGGSDWRWAGSSMTDCPLWTALPDGLTPVDWELDPEASAPTPASRTVDVLVHERACAGGQPVGDLLRGPQIVTTDTEVLVSFAADQRTGSFDCPGNPSTPITVELGETLDERTLRDGRDLGVTLSDVVVPG